MPHSTRTVDWPPLLLAARFQFELVTRGQCLRAGMSVEQIRHCLRTRRWVRVASGVYQTAPGKSGWEVDAAAALLAVTGRGPTDLRSDKGRLQSPPVALFGTAAARAWEMPGVARAPIQLAISAPRTITPVKGAALRRIGRWDERVDPLTFPWRTTKASTIIDCAAGSEPDGALAWLALAVQKRLVPVETLEAELAKRTRLRHGGLMREAMADVTSGAHSAAEVRYVRDVERAHRLPTAIRQSASRVNGGSVHDNDYADFGVVIEVDGRLGHEEWASRIKDGRRDRRLGGAGRFTNRVFWPDVAVTVCATAAEVGALLRARGWTGRPMTCGRPGCAAELAATAAWVSG
ncbi:MAG TPA: hypothetical protein PK868_11790 [Phycicoccus sp.]|jgi:hypothetical protein|nr:hypothetical protein [Phycicoccus sp.]